MYLNVYLNRKKYNVLFFTKLKNVSRLMCYKRKNTLQEMNKNIELVYNNYIKLPCH